MASHKTFVKVINLTSESVELGVSEVDNYDWDGSSRPDRNLQGKTIKTDYYWKPSEPTVAISITEREEINAHARSSWYRLRFIFPNESSFSNATEISVRVDQREALSRDFGKIDTFERGGNTYFVKQTRINGDTLEIAIIEKSAYLCFYALSDTHVDYALQGTENKQTSERAVVTMKGMKHFYAYDYVMNMGDLTNSSRVNEFSTYKSVWWSDEKPFLNKAGWPIICDCYGNHDKEDHILGADLIKELCNVHKNVFPKNLFMKNDFMVSNHSQIDPSKNADDVYDSQHYKWTCNFGNTKIHFIVLNLVPAYFDPSKDRCRISDGSLEFLEEVLKHIGNNDPIFLFHHFGFNANDIDPYDWWTSKEQQDYKNIIKGRNVAGIFYGHCHSTKKTSSLYPNSFCCGGLITSQKKFLAVEIKRNKVDPYNKIDITIRTVMDTVEPDAGYEVLTSYEVNVGLTQEVIS